jgi:hypothetical protein
MEIKPNRPFKSPVEFEETMHRAVLTMNGFLERKYGAHLLGMGMHPFLWLNETGVWPHRHRQIYRAYREIFNLERHGWLNVQSFQLNLPYASEKEGILLHSLLANLCAYLPAIAAASPVYEGMLGEDVDNRLRFYKENQLEVPSVTGDVIPEYVGSFKQYENAIIARYSGDLARAGADDLLLGAGWINSRGVIFRFDRRALEIRVMDEQECVRSDVALSCFVRAALRGMLIAENRLLPHALLVKDYNSIVKNGLNAHSDNPHGPTARDVCQHLFKVALENALEEEKKYLPFVKRRIDNGSLSEVIRDKIKKRAQKTGFEEAAKDIYSVLVKSLIDNKPYF